MVVWPTSQNPILFEYKQNLPLKPTQDKFNLEVHSPHTLIQLK